MFTVKYTPQALSDLRSILSYIARDNPTRAISFVDELQQRTNNFLATAPSGGTPYKEGTRYFSLWNYIVLYEIDEAQQIVQVLHIVSARTNWRREVPS